jgi:N-acetylneuraminic acid mutarotase
MLKTIHHLQTLYVNRHADTRSFIRRENSMCSDKKFPVTSFFRKITRFLLTASLALSGLAAALPQPAWAAPDAPAGEVGSLVTPRAWHTASLLSNGTVLVVGGRNDSGSIASAELYNMPTGIWLEASGVNPAREGHTATMLLNGKVLVVGGFDGANALNNAALYDPARGTWSAAASLATARFNHTATLLGDGSVLIVGGEDTAETPVAAAERYNPTTDTWSSAGALSAPRWDHTATLLPGGWVLVAGGQNGDEVFDTSELYDPAGNSWTSVADTLSTARLGHTATVLPDGQVLIVGGENNDGYLSSAELFTFITPNEASSTWDDTGAMVVSERSGHSATLLPNGLVMVIGGFGDDIADPSGPHALASIELYDSASGTWSGAGALHTTRSYHTATLLPTGEVLIVGGRKETGYLDSVEKIDPTSGNWTPISNMSTDRQGHSATLLADGRVLIAGGTSQLSMLAKAEIYDPASGWSNADDMHTARSNHTATLLPNGKVLVAGGGTGSVFTTSAELYDPQTGNWETTGSLHDARGNHTATLLRNGQVLVVGGLTNNSHYLASAEMYNPDTGVWTQVASLKNARKDHTATLLDDGTVLVTGGFSTEGTEVGFLSSSERYDPGLDDWLNTGTMNAVRGNHTATLLPNGQVLVVGGLNTDSQPPKTTELYDPISGKWSTTGMMSYAHYFHSARLLPNGKVLVAGGVDATGPIAECEVYDLTTAQWQLVNSMGSPRQSFTTTILADGRILATGGQNIDPLNTAEVYDIGQGYLPAWRPTIDSIPPRIKIGKILTFSGTNFRGYQSIEASSSSTHGSPSNYPLVQLRRPDNGQVAWLMPHPELGFSGTVFNSVPLGFPIGPAIVTVYVNGIPSKSVMIQIEAVKTYTPLIVRADPRPFKLRLPLIKR